MIDPFIYCAGCGDAMAYSWDDDTAGLVYECPHLCAYDEAAMEVELLA